MHLGVVRLSEKLNEKVIIVVASVAETEINAYVDVEGLLSKRSNCKHHMIIYIK